MNLKRGSERGRIFIIVENVNPDRATLIFRVHESMFLTAAKEIHTFLQGPEANKRSELRTSNISFIDYGVISNDAVNHDDFYSWKGLMRSKLMI